MSEVNDRLTLRLYLPGFKTTTEDVYVRPDSTFELDASMQPLAPGETSAPVPPAPTLRAAGRRRFQ